jgi:hypothetical protein
MSSKYKNALIILPVLLLFVGSVVLLSDTELRGSLEANVLAPLMLADAIDGTAPPDYRFIMNHREEETPEQIKEDIFLPKVIAEATEHRCGVLIQRLDAGRMFGKFDVGYMMICFDKYPELFTDFFKDLGKPTPKVKVVTDGDEEVVDEATEEATEEVADTLVEIAGGYYTTTTTGSSMEFQPTDSSLLEDGTYLRLLNADDIVNDQALYAKFGLDTFTPIADCEAFHGTATIVAEKYEEHSENKSWSYKVHEVKEKTEPTCTIEEGEV